MPSRLHEVLIELFRHEPTLVAELLADALQVAVPAYLRADLARTDLNDLVPTEFRADAVVVLTGEGDAPVLAVIVEAQLGRDGGKQWSWPVYLTTLRARLLCPVVLLVVCSDAGVARWCAAPIVLGHPGLVLAPLVLGPDQIPAVTDPGEAARTPEVAVLSAMAHGAGPDSHAVLEALVSALQTIDFDHAMLYSVAVQTVLPMAARQYLEGLMVTLNVNYRDETTFVGRYFTRGYAEGEAAGKAEGRADAVLTVLAARGVDVPADARARITACTDLDQLDTWVVRAGTVTTVDELFA